jgi:hypothetical protein
LDFFNLITDAEGASDDRLYEDNQRNYLPRCGGDGDWSRRAFFREKKRAEAAEKILDDPRRSEYEKKNQEEIANKTLLQALASLSCRLSLGSIHQRRKNKTSQ